MSKVHRFFRYVWRANAILILVAAAGVSFAVVTLLWAELGGSAARRRVSDAAPPLGTPDSGERLFLGEVSLVTGTSVMRGELQVMRSGGGFSSGSYPETRNILFVDSQSRAARWLLPDDDHVISEHRDVTTKDEKEGSDKPLATVALVKRAYTDLQTTEGTLLLFDPSGRNVQTVAESVRELHTAALDAGGRIYVLFERRQKYALASFDAVSLEKKEEHELTVPPLK